MQKFPYLLLNHFEPLGIDFIYLRDDSYSRSYPQELADVGVFPRLRHDPFISCYDQQEDVYARGSCHHVAHELLVSRDVHDAGFRSRWEIQGGEAEFDSDTVDSLSYVFNMGTPSRVESPPEKPGVEATSADNVNIAPELLTRPEAGPAKTPPSESTGIQVEIVVGGNVIREVLLPDEARRDPLDAPHNPPRLCPMSRGVSQAKGDTGCPTKW